MREPVNPVFSGFPGIFRSFFRSHRVALVEPDVLKKSWTLCAYRFKSYARLKKRPKNGAKNSNFEKKKNFWENDQDDVENTGLGVSGTFGTFRFSGRDVSKMTLGEFSPQDLVKFSSW